MADKKCVVDSVDYITTRENGKIGLNRICKGRYTYGEVYSDWYDQWVEQSDPFEHVTVIIPCQFDKIVSEDNQYFLVSDNGKWGLYSEQARLLSPLYNDIEVISTIEDDMRIVNVDGKMGLCSLNRCLLEPQYSDIKVNRTSNYGIHIVNADGKLGLCGQVRVREHTLLLDPLYHDIEVSTLLMNTATLDLNTICLVKADGRFGACRYKYKEALMFLDPAYLEIQLASEKWKLLIVRTAEGKTGLFGVDPDKWILEPRYTTIDVLPAIDSKRYETGYSVIIADGSRYGLLSGQTLQIMPEYPWGKVARAARIHFYEKLRKPKKP